MAYSYTGSGASDFVTVRGLYQAMNVMRDIFYPVGSIYASTNNVNPGTFLGGTWERISGKFLFGADDDHVAGTTGGEETHELTIYEVPQHNHTFSATTSNNGGHTHHYNGNQYGWDGAGNATSVHFGAAKTVTNKNYEYGILSAGAHTHTVSGTTSSRGGGQSHNNMPPYLSVYMWKRTA